MLSDEPIDKDFTEDLEALLYAQVYYGKEQEVELPNLTESGPTELGKNKEDQGETTSEKTVSNRHFYRKKRYFENNLVQEDKEKETTESLDKETNTEATTKKSPNIENSVFPPTVESNILPEISEKSEDPTIPPQKDQGLEIESTTNQQFIKISTSSPSTNPSSKDSTQIVTTLSTPSDSNHPQLLNNITINQYLIPPSFEERLRSSLENTPLSKKCKSDLNKLKKGRLSEQDFFNNLKRRLKIQKKQQNQIRKAYLKKQQSIAQSEVICLSDSDCSDVEIVEIISSATNSERKYPTMKETVEVLLNENDAADDDEIIYVEPPPVPVINIDTESDSNSSDNDKEESENMAANSQKPKNATSSPDSQQVIDETSDDFLQPKNTPDNFNFSLHGSDFQNTDFVRPANPTDIYETESSTSTSDFNRDSSRQFCNSVKTIVFNEVDFPNQDIFDESNLESFGEFITPKRGDKSKNTESSSYVDKPSSSKSSKRVNPRTSSESSSESEYDGSIDNQNLPDLSPMVCADSSPKKSKTKKKNAWEQPKRKREKLEKKHEYNTRSGKRKSKEKFVDKNCIIDNAELAVVKEPTRKSKRKSCDGSLEEDESAPRKKSRTKKNKSGSKNAEDNENMSEVSNRTLDRSASPKKNIRDNYIVTSSTPSKKKGIEDESDSLEEFSKKKSKKRKKHSRNENNLGVDKSANVLGQDILNVAERDPTEDSSKKKVKKKKAKESSVNKTSEDGKVEGQRKILEDNNRALAKEQGNVSEDSGKKISKKRKQKESSEIGVVSEASSTANDENELTKRTERENNTNINMLFEEQEIIAAETDILLEQNNTSENSNTKKKNKRKKRTSTDKSSSVEESNVSSVENEIVKEKSQERGKENDKDDNKEEGELGEDEDKEIIVEVPQTQEGDVILIEKVIPVHTIDSSESEEDILTFKDVTDDLALANITGIKEKFGVVMGNRKFDVDYVQSKMSDDPQKWKILPTDRYNLSITKKGPRCNKCRQFGHISINCPNKPAEPVCTLCGESGHQEPRCPNRVCFTCGKPGNFSTIYCYMCAKQRNNKCHICFIVGHNQRNCPDLWRRYFLTTTEGPLNVPRKNCPTLKTRSKQWCSGCASNGHLEFECNTYKWIREYPAASPEIFKYNDVYADQRKEKPAAPRTPRSIDRERVKYDRFVSSLNRPVSSGTNSEQPTTQKNTLLDKNLEENNSHEKVLETGENLEGTGKSAESLTTENQGANRQINENQSTLQSATEDRLIDPETNFDVAAPNANQSVLSPPHTPSNQMSYAASGQRNRRRRRRSPRSEKINPLSVLRPTGFTPYDSVLNPYSVLGAPSARPPQDFFNQVPGNILASHLMDLASTVSNYQNLWNVDQSRNVNQNSFSYQNQANFYQGQQYGSQIPPNPNPIFSPPSHTYQDFFEPLLQEPYYNVQEPYGGRDFLDRPHTVTRDPMENRERVDVQSPHHQMEDIESFIEDRDGQIQQNSNPTSNAFKGFFQPIIPEAEVIYENRNVVDRHHTITTNSMQDIERFNFKSPECDIREREVLVEAREGNLYLQSEKSNVEGGEYLIEDRGNHVGVQPAEEIVRGEAYERNRYRDKSGPKNHSVEPQINDNSVITKVQKILRVSNRTSDSIEVGTIKKFRNMPPKDLKKMVCQELEKLDGLEHLDTNTYRRKLKTISDLTKIRVKTKEIENQIHYLYKEINMFLFGVHRLHDGRENLEILKSFVDKPICRIKQKNRLDLLKAYINIFGGENHDNSFYKHCFNTLFNVQTGSKLAMPRPYDKVKKSQNLQKIPEIFDKPHTITREHIERLDFEPAESYLGQRQFSIGDKESNGSLRSSENHVKAREYFAEDIHREGEAYERKKGECGLRKRLIHSKNPNPYSQFLDTPTKPQLNDVFFHNSNTITREPIEQIGSNIEPTVFREKEANERVGDESGSRETLNLSKDLSTNSKFLNMAVKPQLDAHIPERTVCRPEIILTETKEQSTIYAYNKTINSIEVKEDTLQEFRVLSCNALKRKISLQLQELEKCRHADTNIYKRKLQAIDRMKKKKGKTRKMEYRFYALFQQINMFLFGVHQLRDGKKNLVILKNFVNKQVKRIKQRNRIKLLEAYTYIFGGQHPDYNYYRHSLYTLLPDQPSSNLNPLLDSTVNLCKNVSEPTVPELNCRVQEPQNIYENRDSLIKPITITKNPLKVPVKEKGIFVEARRNSVGLQPIEGIFRGEIFEKDKCKDGSDLQDTLNRSKHPDSPSIFLEMPLGLQTEGFVPEKDLTSHDNIDTQNTKIPNLLINVEKSIIDKFNKLPIDALKTMICQELKGLETIQRTDKNTYIRKLNTIENLTKIQVKTEPVLKDMYFLHKHVNMFLFGVHGVLKGKIFLQRLVRFGNDLVGGVSNPDRKKLLKAYGYIFGGRHDNFNYKRCLDNITNK